MDTCGDCAFYDAIDDVSGSCKCKHAERHIAKRDNHNYDVVNGWPTVPASDKACGDHA
jgi:hypothetical protein